MTKLFVQLLHKDSKAPVKSTTHASGYDVYAYLPFDSHPAKEIRLEPHETTIVPTGLKVSTELGHDIKLFPRSGLAAKKDTSITLSNAVGVIDLDFRHELKVLLHNSSDNWVMITHEERIAQLLVQVVPDTELTIVDQLPDIESNRTGGFGSTGTHELSKDKQKQANELNKTTMNQIIKQAH